MAGRRRRTKSDLCVGEQHVSYPRCYDALWLGGHEPTWTISCARLLANQCTDKEHCRTHLLLLLHGEGDGERSQKDPAVARRTRRPRSPDRQRRLPCNPRQSTSPSPPAAHLPPRPRHGCSFRCLLTFRNKLCSPRVSHQISPLGLSTPTPATLYFTVSLIISCRLLR
jgi:hypothetical protein